MDEIEITHVELSGTGPRAIKYLDVRVALALLIAPGLVVALPTGAEE